MLYFIFNPELRRDESPAINMRYHTLILCLLAGSLCLGTRRMDEQSSLGYAKPNTGLNPFHLVKIDGDEISLREDVVTCGRSLNLFATPAARTTSNNVSLSACERVVAVMGSVLDTYQREYHPKRKYRRDEVCEAKVCENENLEKTCNSKNIELDAALICKMCYPKKNVNLINSHCQAKWRRERRAFYVISFILIAFTITSGLVLYLRRRYLRAKQKGRGGLQDNGPVEEINPPGELYYYDGTRPLDINSSSVANSPLDTRQHNEMKRYGGVWEDDSEGGIISTSSAQRKLRQLGLLSRSGRKGVNGLFDVEAVRPRYDATENPRRQSNDTCRVPVMPWAPNASIRLSDRETQRVRARTVSSKGSPVVELREILTNGANAV